MLKKVGDCKSDATTNNLEPKPAIKETGVTQPVLSLWGKIRENYQANRAIIHTLGGAVGIVLTGTLLAYYKGFLPFTHNSGKQDLNDDKQDIRDSADGSAKDSGCDYRQLCIEVGHEQLKAPNDTHSYRGSSSAYGEVIVNPSSCWLDIYKPASALFERLEACNSWPQTSVYPCAQFASKDGMKEGPVTVLASSLQAATFGIVPKEGQEVYPVLIGNLKNGKLHGTAYTIWEKGALPVKFCFCEGTQLYDPRLPQANCAGSYVIDGQGEKYKYIPPDVVPGLPPIDRT